LRWRGGVVVGVLGGSWCSWSRKGRKPREQGKESPLIGFTRKGAIGGLFVLFTPFVLFFGQVGDDLVAVFHFQLDCGNPLFYTV